VSRSTRGPAVPACSMPARLAAWARPGARARQAPSATLTSTSRPSTRQATPPDAPAYCQARPEDQSVVGKFGTACGSCAAGPCPTQLAIQTKSAWTPPFAIACSGAGFE
jgi:hypothetical protein